MLKLQWNKNEYFSSCSMVQQTFGLVTAKWDCMVYPIGEKFAADIQYKGELVSTLKTFKTESAAKAYVTRELKKIRGEK